MRIVITGAAGNLGSKLTAHLQAADWCSAVLGIDPKPVADHGKFVGIVADLRDAGDARWIEAVHQADAVVHFAAQNPAPDSDWLEATQSLDMTLNLLNRLGARACRFVFASSNHVMGGYRDTPLPADRKLTAATPPLPGTRTFDGTRYYTPQAYGSSKLMGERAVAARAAALGGMLTAVNVRIGWVQRGENRPQTLGPHGAGTNHGPGQPSQEEFERARAWFRGMWLSNRDFVHLMEQAIRVPAAAWPAPAILVAGVSNNSGTLWDLDAPLTLLGYRPQDDVTAA